MAFPFASLISAGSSLLGGLLGRSSAEDQARRQENLQREFAQNSIQWRAEDARKAGIHPAFALGAQTTSYQPVSVGDPLPAALSDMGQDLSRAAQASASNDGRATVLGNLAIERAGLENELLRSQIARYNSAQLPPGAPADSAGQVIPGQADIGSIRLTPMPRTSASSRDPGHIPDVGWSRTPTGFVPIPSLDVKQRIEDIMPHEWAHYFRNNILPALSASRMNPPFPARPGERWVYEAGEYRLKPVRRGANWRAIGTFRFN